MEFEDILRQVGDYGRYQKLRLYLLLIPISMTLPLFGTNVLFFIATPDHWCYVPEIASSDLSTEVQHRLTRPKALHQGKESLSKCEIYDVDYEEVLRNYTNAVIQNKSEKYLEFHRNTWTKKKCTNGWVYDKFLYEATAVTEWNLVCDNDYWPAMVLTMYSIGSVVGNLIFGFISDKIGRRYAFYATVIVGSLAMISPVLIQDFTAFLVLRCIQGTVLPAIFQLPYVILIELIGPQNRSKVITLSFVAWTLGFCTVALIAYLCRHWILFAGLTTVVVIPYFLYWKFLPESPRWLISQGRIEEVTIILKDIAKTNNKKLPDNLDDTLKKMCEILKKEKEEKGESLVQFIRNASLRKFLVVLSIGWIAIGMAYRGLQLNFQNLAGNEFVNFTILAAAELPSIPLAWWMMESRLGRRWSIVLLMFLTVIACTIPVFVPPEYSSTLTISSLIGKFGTSAEFLVIYQQVAELIPTPLRSQGLGLLESLTSGAGTVMPYVVYLSTYGYYIPYLVLAVVCGAAGLVLSLLPETLNENLPQTVKDSEILGKGKPFFSLAKKRNPEEVEMNDITNSKGQNESEFLSTV